MLKPLRMRFSGSVGKTDRAAAGRGGDGLLPPGANSDDAPSPALSTGIPQMTPELA
jgi:hypothetical protein